MPLAVVYSRASVGMDAPLVSVEVHLSNGLPAFQLAGLPEATVREARDRVRSALINSGFEFPSRRITVNLAPADLPKEGGRFDLAIAIGIIAASGQISVDRLKDYEMAGELALSGQLRPITGSLPFAHACYRAERQVILPESNCQEAALIQSVRLLPARSLTEVYHHLIDHQNLDYFQAEEKSDISQQYELDMTDIVGQYAGKRALEIAAAGQHNLLLSGPPGTGKTMLAQRLMSLLPEMTEEQALETATVYSIIGQPVSTENWKQRRYRTPHHTSSAVALVGGGSIPKPGEISLAHNGVLFLDELPEYDRRVLDVLREPLESGFVSISRAARQATFPARFQLIAAMNPSPTGSLDDGRSNPDQILRYLNRISGPFLDRIDLQVEVAKMSSGDISSAKQNRGESSALIRERVYRAQQIQLARNGTLNGQLSNKAIDAVCQLSEQDSAFLLATVEKLGLSFRVYHKVLKVARTIADLAGEKAIQQKHLAEAIGFRAFDRMLKQFTARH